ncbi:DUF1731 domain-containing protein [Chryseobacterium oryctis]|uniref:DUF1731 domain-containing protein n=1 Tax=Chryseobacterium oryctis TaxID=2952618 RepID=A0ABT3HPQ5_9FLAO|nr:DUF1731 domain-containing protein [Chryseobacterium oryctis]MCW3161757.1 DUF1731 domain-containing protein [Chryseobacterium oryctis]
MKTEKKGIGFAADLSDDWEKAADRFKEDGIAENVSKIRVSLVLGNEGGIFPVYEQIVKSDPNIIFKENDSAVPWNHVEDMAGIFAFAVEKKLDDIYNSVAPQPASQQDIYKAISNELGLNDKLPISKFKGQHLVSRKIENEGFVFKYPDIEKAVKNLITKSKI